MGQSPGHLLTMMIKSSALFIFGLVLIASSLPAYALNRASHERDDPTRLASSDGPPAPASTSSRQDQPERIRAGDVTLVQNIGEPGSGQYVALGLFLAGCVLVLGSLRAGRHARNDPAS